ncbi:aminopeptidase N [Catenuloplanes atrovinosus]|uniref:Aminopeptidase N n=1 Tax=Catenuloplanes atrovinosus TaxID=137266 RepID=A0AAE3YRG5_9ACTN|nr:aminopeptidase N [Catenuloplanes atrovinosus]MDR7278633.1 aminopeptidase N [Catenuloplanes atrovinosus]
MRSLTRAEAVERAALLTVDGYEIHLDLTGGPELFRSSTTIRFRAASPGPTFAEVKPHRLLSARLNGTDLDVATLDGNRLPLAALLTGDAENVLTVEAEMAYTNTGDGLHRFVDPADGEVYLYGGSFLDESEKVFASFDQPDLKAPFTLTVRAPEGWLVAANGAEAARQDGLWTFATTRPLATYFFSLIAGPYHLVTGEHDGIPLGLYCRASLAGDLDKDAAEILDVTARCLDRFHELFGVRYPFGKYDQAFVPEFNAGAMENPGLVTFRDDYVFRSAVTETEHELRATVIAHEMAHMWFGDLVTMRWWDDLWLNESFAEHMGYRVIAEVTDRQTWTTFGMRRKGWGYAADQRPSTHPVAPAELEDSALALLNFDGISYAKGAAVLRQLVAFLGDEAFLTGLRDYFRAHAFGNATLADLLDALSRAAGRDLTGWADLWLRRPQVNTLTPEITPGPDGTWAEVAVRQTAPPDHPTLRPHRIRVGLYDRVGAEVVCRERFETDLTPETDGGRTVLDRLAGARAADLLLLNDGDLTYAKVRLDDASASAVPLVLPGLEDSLTRAVIWSATIDAVQDADRPVADLVSLVLAALPAEREVIIVEDVLLLTGRLVDRYLDAAAREDALLLVATACDRLLAAAPPGHSLQLAAARSLIGSTRDTARLRDWLAGRGVPEGLAVDADLRWRLLAALVVLGEAGAAEIEAESERDRSAAGELWAGTCTAALPDPAAKERAWQRLYTDETLSNRMLVAYGQGFWQPEQSELTAPYVERYFAEIPEAAPLRSGWSAERLAALTFPAYAVSPETRAASARLLAREDLHPAVRRAVTDADDDMRRALRSRGL